MQVRVQDGKVVEVRGHPDHPPTAGALCTKVARYPERLNAPDRLLYPHKRVGPKGAGQWVRTSWDEALHAIAARLQALRAEDPQAILPYSYAGTMGLVQGSFPQRFFHAIGASLLDRTICASAGAAGLKYTLGASVGMDVERFVDSKLILIWGSNSITSNLHFWRLAQEAQRRGAKLIAIDPLRTETAARCDVHLPIRPGSDGALVLGLIHQLEALGALDPEWLQAHCLGAAELLARARPWNAARTASACGIDPQLVIDLASDYATIRPAAIRLNYGMQRVRGGANAVRLVAALPALIGAWRDRAGGLLLSSSGHFPMDGAALERPDLLPQWPSQPRTLNMSTLGDVLTCADPPVRALVVYNSNPAAVAPDSERVLQGLARPDLFCVVLEHFVTDTARYADWLLPATMQMEHYDLHKSYGHRYLLANLAAVAAPGECRPNSQIFRDLARAMDLQDPALFESDREVARQAVRWEDPRCGGATLEDLESRGWLKMQVDDDALARGHFPTPSGKVELLSARLEGLGFDPLPDWLPNRESPEQDPALASRYPLEFISPPARHFLNSSFVNVQSLQLTERTPRCLVHPQDAAARAIATGDRVEIHNDRGRTQATAEVSDKVRPGVVAAYGVWWHALTPGGRNVNAVTSQALTDLGQAPTFYDCLVQVSKL